MAAQRTAKVKQALNSVARLFATPSISPPTQPSYRAPADVPVLPTGFRPLDKAIGVGGLPQGKVIELIGPGTADISGGTLCLASRIAAKAQLQQAIITIIDMNHSFDSWQAERCGLIAAHLLVTQPDTLFAALSSLESAGQHAELVIVVMGIVAELLRDIEAELLGTLLQRLRGIVGHSECVFLFVTALHKDDPFDPANYPAGFPLAEIADLRLWTQDETWSHKDGMATAYKANITVIKNSLAMVGKGASVRINLAGS